MNWREFWYLIRYDAEARWEFITRVMPPFLVVIGVYLVIIFWHRLGLPTRN